VNAPTWLTDSLVAALLCIAGFFGWRMLAARGWSRRADYPRDALYALAAVALAETQASWFSTLPRPAWAVLFGLAALFFAVSAARAYRSPNSTSSWRHSALDTGIALIMLYAFTAGIQPSTLRGSTAGLTVMAGMPGMIVTHSVRYPTLGLLLAAGLLGYAVVMLDRLSARTPEPATVPALAPMDRPGPLPLLAPRAADACRVALAIFMAYAIIAHLV
jgi:hypothetical protein